MYWQIGKYISEKADNDGWGKGVVQDFANFLKQEYPSASGFSAQNIWRMKQFYETYKDKEKLSPLVREITKTNRRKYLSKRSTIRLYHHRGHQKTTSRFRVVSFFAVGDSHTDHHENAGFFYFNLTDEQITRDHKITTKGLPQCLDPTHGYHFRQGTVFSSAGNASDFFKKAFLNSSGPYAVRFSLDGDIPTIIKKAMRHAPVTGYRYQYSPSQRTALIWGG